MRRMLFHIILAYTAWTDISNPPAELTDTRINTCMVTKWQTWSVPKSKMKILRVTNKAHSNKTSLFHGCVFHIWDTHLNDIQVSGTANRMEVGNHHFFFFLKQNTRREKHLSHSKVLWWNYKLLKNCVYNGNADRPFRGAVWCNTVI